MYVKSYTTIDIEVAEQIFRFTLKSSSVNVYVVEINDVGVETIRLCSFWSYSSKPMLDELIHDARAYLAELLGVDA